MHLISYAIQSSLIIACRRNIFPTRVSTKILDKNLQMYQK